MLSTPPKNDEDDIFTFTLSGTKISAPPNTHFTSITVSLFIFAFLKSKSIPPNTLVKFAPSNFSSDKLTS